MIATIDFEAAGFSGSPIEVGVALWDRDGPIKTWSSLIYLVEDSIWDPAAEAIHGISKQDLAGAPHPARVCERLNKIMMDVDIAYCDGLPHDAFWLAALYQDGGMAPVFNLRSIVAMHKLQRFENLWNRMRHYLDQSLIVHRAGDDALQLMQAYAYAIGAKPDVVDLS